MSLVRLLEKKNFLEKIRNASYTELHVSINGFANANATTKVILWFYDTLLITFYNSI